MQILNATLKECPLVLPLVFGYSSSMYFETFKGRLIGLPEE
jgi:hypothetical protein